MATNKKLFYWGIVIGAFLGIVGCAALIAIPFFLDFSNPGVHTEVQTNLAAIFTLQSAYFDKYGVYAGCERCFSDVEWWRDGCCNRYSYYCGERVIKNSWGGDCQLPDVPHGVTDNSFTVMAVGNIDGDPECDIWTMNDAKVMKNVIREDFWRGRRPPLPDILRGKH